MIRFWLLLLVVLTGVGMLASCDKVDEGAPTNPGGDGEPGIPDRIALARAVAPILANGVAGADIFVTVVDGNRRALADIGVSFSTTAGSVVAFATTNSQGIAQTRLTSVASVNDVNAVVTAAAAADTVSGAPLPGDFFLLVTGEPVSPELAAEAMDLHRGDPARGIAATAADISAQIPVKMLGVTLTLSAAPAVLPADGRSTGRVSARLVETTTRIPLEGEEVRFGASVGSITGRVSTDGAGTANAELTSTSGGATSQITAFYGNVLTATVSVSFSTLRLSVETGVPGIGEDGGLVTPIRARLINAENNPVAGVAIEFTTTAGTISSPATTGADGAASAVLRTGAATTQATVTARFGSLVETRQIGFAPLSFTLVADSPSIRADGNATTRITATLTTADADPLPGVRILFTTTAGTVTPSAETGEDGKAVATLTSGLEPGNAVVTASYAKDKQATASVAFVAAPVPSSLVVTADDSSVLADGLASTVISAIVTDALGNPPPAGTSVAFTTTRGVLDNVLPTDEDGVATARLKATRFQTGLARVTATLSDLQGAVDVKFISGSAAQIVVQDVENPSIGVRGSGDLETAVITYEVRDANGIPVDADHPATLTFAVVPKTGQIDATVSPATATTNEDGAVIATVQSGLVSGAIELEATSGSLVSKPIRIAIHGGLPDPAHFSVSTQRLNIAGLVFDGIQNGITARVGDQHGNPVPLETAVWFKAQYGLVQGSAFTDDHGEATVWEITAAPRPPIPGGNGLVEITAQTVSAAGNLITTSTHVLWSGPTVMQITSPQPGFNVPNSGSISIQFKVSDANGNPLTGGTQIRVEATAGALGGTTDFTLPDTQNVLYTNFAVVLSDADPEEVLAEPVTVTMTVLSQNGNSQASITGTVN